MNLEEKIVQSLGEEFQKTEEFEILSYILISMRGYTRVEINYGPDQFWTDVIAWVGLYCSGEYREHNGIWLFELAEDATMFKLKWL